MLLAYVHKGFFRSPGLIELCQAGIRQPDRAVDFNGKQHDGAAGVLHRRELPAVAENGRRGGLPQGVEGVVGEEVTTQWWTCETAFERFVR